MAYAAPRNSDTSNWPPLITERMDTQLPPPLQEQDSIQATSTSIDLNTPKR